MSSSNRATVWAAVTCAAVCFAMVTSESFWIDEFETLKYAQIDGFREFLTRVSTTPTSESQMPGYMLYTWSWHKLASQNEWVWRASNLLWLFVAIWAIARTGQLLKLPWLVPLFVIQPFLWFYANELRPYCMQIAGGSVALYSLALAIRQRMRGLGWAVLTVLAAWILCLSSMLGAIPTFVLFVLILALPNVSRCRVNWRGYGVILLGSLPLLCLGGYYALTIARGSGGTRIWNVSLANLVFAFYELFGFSGLGPSRILLREMSREGGSALAAGVAPYLAGLVSLAIVLGGIFCYRLLRKRSGSLELTTFRTALAFVILNLTLMFGLALAAEWPFWGRHLAPVFPFVVLLEMWCVVAAWQYRVGRIAVAALIFLLAASSVNLRLSGDHRKDDYQQALALCRTAVRSGETVWWVAHDTDGIERYSLSNGLTGQAAQRIIVLIRPSESQMMKSPEPDVIVMSKKDIYDVDGFVQDYVAAHSYELAGRFPAFHIWRPTTANTASE